MKKEVFVAILLGLSFGLIVTYGIYRASQADTQQQLATILETTNLDVENEDTNSISTIVIDSPLNESIVDEQRQTISGTTISNSFVIIYVNETPYITTADQAGAFSVSADLRLGSNVIGVHALDENGQETVAEIVVGYTTQPLFSQTATDSADTNDANTEADQE
jgi:ABC-type uncharacterized transport system ATPase subunit